AGQAREEPRARALAGGCQPAEASQSVAAPVAAPDPVEGSARQEAARAPARSLDAVAVREPAWRAATQPLAVRASEPVAVVREPAVAAVPARAARPVAAGRNRAGSHSGPPAPATRAAPGTQPAGAKS